MVKGEIRDHENVKKYSRCLLTGWRGVPRKLKKKAAPNPRLAAGSPPGLSQCATKSCRITSVFSQMPYLGRTLDIS
jgi:hypothetical protein